MRTLILILSLLSYLWSFETKKIEKFLENASFDALCPNTNKVLIMKRDGSGILQLYIVDGNSTDPEKEMVCLSCSPRKAIGVASSLIPLLHKGASDWHPSGEWFITEMEIPFNISWKYLKKLPGTRLLAEPGAGWWNNLFLVKKDGSIWIKLTDFKPSHLNSGVLYPKFSKDGRRMAWAERIGGAKPYDKFPFAKWVMKIGIIDWDSEIPQLKEIKTLSMEDGAIFEPQEWSSENRLLFAADIGYSNLPYPGYRIDLWEAQIDENGNVTSKTNLTRTNNFYEEQASYSLDQKFIAFMGNLFDSKYEERLLNAWKRYKNKPNNFITTNLTTDLYLMDRKGEMVSRLTDFSKNNWGNNHYLVTRSAWSASGKEIFVSLTLRENLTGKKTGEFIYKITLK